MATSNETRLSLLEGLRNSRSETRFENAWTEFNRRYTPMMLRWIETRGLNHGDAEEICQELMVCLLKRLKTFVYEPSQSFRAWLKTVTTNAVCDFVTKRRRQIQVEDQVIEGLLENDGLEARLSECFDLELLESARRNVEQRLCGTETGRRNWGIFSQLQAEDASPEELATRYGIRRHAVYVARHRVLESLKREVERIQISGPTD